MIFFNNDYIDFFKELAQNNNKDWFDLNRKRYETNVKKPFVLFVEAMLSYFSLIDQRFKEVKASECIFRINRDIRFSKNKEPYKTYCSAVISFGGKKGKHIEGVYVELAASGVHFYIGAYDVDKEDLYFLREGICNHLEEYQTIVNHREFQSFFGKVLGDRNKIIPKEFQEKAKIEPSIFNKHWYFKSDFPAQLILTKKLQETTIQAFELAKPFQSFFNKFLAN